MVDVAHGRGAWTASEAGHLAACAECGAEWVVVCAARDAGDAPAMLNYGGGLDQPITDANIGIHHAQFGKALKAKMEPLGIRCVVQASGEVLGGGRPISPIVFLKQELGLAE